MTLRERIEKMISKAEVEKKGATDNDWYFWNGYQAFGEELLLVVKPKDKE